jgi:hypothetical protein
MGIYELGANHDHCWHAYRGPIWMVIPDGHVLEKCCKCETTRLIHIDHLHEHGSRLNTEGRWVHG